MTPDQKDEDDHTFTQKIEVAGEQLVDTVKELFNDSTAKKVTIRTHEGEKLLSVPLTVGVTGGALTILLAPALAAVAAFGGTVAKLKLEVEREGENS